MYGERTPGAAALPVAWVKTIIPVTGAMLVLQGLAHCAVAIETIRKGKVK